jgi:hypothetical protein
MLEQLMKQLQQGETTSVPALARQFEVSEALVAQMLSELVRLGYLRLQETCSHDACTGCPQSTGCSTRRPVQTWAVIKETAK